jgi:Na+-driven multidrug efflux pump
MYCVLLSILVIIIIIIIIFFGKDILKMMVNNGETMVHVYCVYLTTCSTISW